MKRCSKCGYIRQPNDYICISPLECPKCGIVYKKHENYLKQKRIEQEAERKIQEQAERSAQEQAETEPGQEILNVSEHRSVIKNFTKNLSIEGFFGLLRRSDTLCRLFSYLKDSKPIQWLIKYKDTIASLLFILWILGCCFWFYLFIIINVNPYENWGFFSYGNPQNSKEALTILFFGMLACIFIITSGLFIIKFAYNLFYGGIECLIPKEWNPLIKSIILLLFLCFAFLSIKKIKRTRLTAYYQTAEIVQIARKHKVILNVNAPASSKLIEDDLLKE